MKISNRLSQIGFTMIELLVVIAVIGILSVAVLSTINPIEQINKGRDTRSQADAAQMLQAIDRFFALREGYPWNFDGPSQTDNTDWDAEVSGVTGLVTGSEPSEQPNYGASFALDELLQPRLVGITNQAAYAADGSHWGWANIMIGAGEIKEGFFDRVARTTDQTKFVLYKPALANATTYICYPPTSLSFAQEALERCTNETEFGVFGSGGTDTVLREAACGDAGATPTCTADTDEATVCLVCVP